MLFRRTTPGDIPGEVIRSITQFKSFAATFTYLHGARGLAQQGIGNKAMYATSLILPMTLAGAFAEQMSAISRGQEPRDMLDTKFWASAIARGGSLGPIGDFLFSEHSRHGHGFIASLAGPLAGQLETGVKLAHGAFAGDNVADDIRRFAEGFLPGNSLWYGRLAIERLMKDQLELLADPKAERKWRRAERKRRRDFGNDYWWSRGELTPQ